MDNNVAIDLICTHIRRQLDERSRSFHQNITRSQSKEQIAPSSGLSIRNEKSNLHVLEQTAQLRVCILSL